MPWSQTNDPTTGKPYYYHTDTRETRWDRPPEMDAPLMAVNQSSLGSGGSTLYGPWVGADVPCRQYSHQGTLIWAAQHDGYTKMMEHYTYEARAAATGGGPTLTDALVGSAWDSSQIQPPPGSYLVAGVNDGKAPAPAGPAGSRPAWHAAMAADLDRVSGRGTVGSSLDDLYEQCVRRVGELAAAVERGVLREPGPSDRIWLLRWQLLAQLDGADRAQLAPSSACLELLGNQPLLELLLSSGQCGLATGETSSRRADRWLSVCRILFELMSRDRSVADPGSIQSRIAVACALSFHTPDSIKPGHHFGTSHAPATNPVARYEYFVNVHARGELYGSFDESTAWHMRNVVGANMSDSDMDWCRRNVPESHRARDQVGEAGHTQMTYKKENHTTNASIFGDDFYDNKLITVELLWEYGGVCGCMSRAGVGMAQANGVPAMPVGAPGHCAYLWQIRPGEWSLSYAATGTWANCTRHPPYQVPFDSLSAFMVPLMELCQADLEAYSQSERTRVLAEQVGFPSRGQLLLQAAACCPYNMAVWQARMQLLDDAWKAGYDVAADQWVTQTRDSVARVNRTEQNISFRKPVTASTQQAASNIVDSSSSEWYERGSSGWLEIDLMGLCSIRSIEIQWWAISVADNYRVLSRANANQPFRLRRTERDASENPMTGDYNQWSKLTGWDEPTSHIRIELANGHKDPWGMDVTFGIRQVNLTGVREEIVDTLPPHKCLAVQFEKMMMPVVHLGGVEAAVAWYHAQLTNLISTHQGELISTPIEELQQPGETARVSDNSLRPASNLVDGTDSEWWTSQASAWVEIKLHQMCTVTAVEVRWWGNSVAKRIQVLSSCNNGSSYTLERTEEDDSEQRHRNPGCNDWTKIPGWSRMTDTVRLELEDGTPSMWDPSLLFGIRNLKVIGRKGHRQHCE